GVSAAARARGLVKGTEGSLGEMVGPVLAHSSETRLMDFIKVAIDALDVLLLTLADAARTHLEEDQLLLRKITGSRTDVLRRFRESYFPEGGDVAGREAAGLLSISDQFDVIVRLAGQYEGLLSSGWCGPRFAAVQQPPSSENQRVSA